MFWLYYFLAMKDFFNYLTNASLDGRHCDALAFWDSSTAPYTIEYMDIGVVEGTYSLVADVSDASLQSTGHYADDTGTGAPYTTPALYSIEVEVTYRSPSVYYRTTHRVAPGEPDA